MAPRSQEQKIPVHMVVQTQRIINQINGTSLWEINEEENFPCREMCLLSCLTFPLPGREKERDSLSTHRDLIFPRCFSCE